MKVVNKETQAACIEVLLSVGEAGEIAYALDVYIQHCQSRGQTPKDSAVSMLKALDEATSQG